MTPYLIRISSQKGGVGKTTVAINLAAAFAWHGKDVLLADSDVIIASIADFLGMEEPKVGFNEVLFKQLEAKQYFVRYEPGNFDVLPNTKIVGKYEPTLEMFKHIKAQIDDLKYDFIVADSPPGVFSPAASAIAGFFNQGVMVSTPQETTLHSNEKLMEIYKDKTIENVMVLNRVGSSTYELGIDAIKEQYGFDIAAVLPEDPIVPRSIFEKKPAYILDRQSRFSQAMDLLAKRWIDNRY
ncbi:MAG: MinD/ParA family protein [Candidatus Micrarchaeota archaeon]|nr:MinD/ParA family protein [Candidatus Micrarchaeota archaeon]